jgi:UDPglucose 6-dehydrogenase
LQDLIAKHGGSQLRATLSHHEAIEETDITMVLVNTPSDPDGNFSTRHVEAALRSLAQAFGESDKEHHLFVISSTVMPGSTNESFIPLLEEHSGRNLHQDFDVCYDPDFVALGDVINGFLEPEIVVIGESRPEAGARMEAVHQQLCLNEPHIGRMSIISAEIAKVALNAYITMKISYANALANLCEQIPGADVDAITSTIGVDRRISTHYFTGGLSFGGTCFPRDTQAYINLAAQHDNDAELIKAVEEVNAYQDAHLAEVVLREVDGAENKTVGILGLAFKPDTPVITESPAVKLIEELLHHDLRVVAYDPLATENVRALFNESIEYVSSAEECLAQSGVCVLTHRSIQLKQIIEEYHPTGPLAIVDGWRVVDQTSLDPQVKYVPLGQHPGE